MSSSFFASLVSEVLSVPESTDTITIRKLAPKHLDDARRVSQDRAFEDVRRTRESLPPDFLERIASATAGESGPVDPLLAYDRVTLMRHGVTAWSFPKPLEVESFEDIPEDRADWLARAILRLAKPALFQTDDEAEGARKNG